MATKPKLTKSQQAIIDNLLVEFQSMNAVVETTSFNLFNPSLLVDEIHANRQAKAELELANEAKCKIRHEIMNKYCDILNLDFQKANVKIKAVKESNYSDVKILGDCGHYVSHEAEFRLCAGYNRLWTEHGYELTNMYYGGALTTDATYTTFEEYINSKEIQAKFKKLISATIKQ